MFGTVSAVASLSSLILLYWYGMQRFVNCRKECLVECLTSCAGNEIRRVSLLRMGSFSRFAIYFEV